MKNFHQHAAVKGWIQLNRSDDVLQVIRINPLAYTLATIIALRARWRDGFNEYGLEHGEALLGDHEEYGMSQQNYRTAKAQLEKWKFATFKSTNAGTIAKLIDLRLFSITAAVGNKRANERPTNAQRTPNERVTTNQPSNTFNKDNKETKWGTSQPEAQPPTSQLLPQSEQVGSVAFNERKLTPPTLGQVRAQLRLSFSQGECFAEQYFRIFNDQRAWLDRNDKPIIDWRKHCVVYAKAAFLGQEKNRNPEREAAFRKMNDRNSGTANAGKSHLYAAGEERV